MIIRTNNGPADAVPEGAVIMLGYFDGFHEGHKALAEAAYRIRKEKNAPCVMLWTFRRLAKGKAITDNREKAEAFFSYRPDTAYVVFEDFAAVSHLSGEEFVRDVLKSRFAPCAVVCGFDFRFGKNGACGPEELSEYCRTYGIGCCVVPPVTVNGKPVSSTEIRQLIEAGDVHLALQRMGRPYALTAPVIHGKRIGRTLGFPTVNQRIPEEKAAPAKGIYACRVTLPDGTVHNGVCNIGSRPTVNGDPSDITVETFILDFSGDLYGDEITVSFYRKLRDEMRFSSKEELAAQIARDKQSAADYFASAEMPAVRSYSGESCTTVFGGLE